MQTGEGKISSMASLSSAVTLTKMGVSHVPQRYILPASHRPNTLPPFMNHHLPIIDLSSLQNPFLRPQTMDEIRIACKEIGFFQVINHGVPPSVMKGALDAAVEFFDLSMEEKMVHASDNVHEPVRYGTSMNQVKDEFQFWRDFIKHYSHPLSSWIHLWPSNPPSYKEKMGSYAKEVQVLQKQLMEVVLESLGLNPNDLQDEVESGSQVMAINCYPACPEPELALGMPPHSDFGSLTVLLQSCLGLQVLDNHNNWLSVPFVEDALIVQLGDQLEVMSNGQYKSVVHRVTVSSEKKRFSIASLHSWALEKKMGPAEKLVDQEHPASYEEFSFKDFLDYISNNDIMTAKRFIDTLKKKKKKTNHPLKMCK